MDEKIYTQEELCMTKQDYIDRAKPIFDEAMPKLANKIDSMYEKYTTTTCEASKQNDSRKAKKASMREYGITGKQYRRALRWAKREALKNLN